jgi:threonyl-tRNA synthetase
MIHRALLGSIERFMGILLEHYGGNLPTWLAPQQALVLPIADRHAEYAAGVARQLREAGAAAAVDLRVDLDARGESVGKRIRDAQLQKVPYILVVGDREQESGAVGVRERGEDKGPRPLAAFADHLIGEVRERRLPLSAGAGKENA